MKNFLDKNVKGNTKIDLKTEVIDQFDGRFSLATWYQRPATSFGRETIVGIGIKDEKVMKEVIKKMIDAVPFKDRIEERKFGKYSYHYINSRQNRPEEEKQPEKPRQPNQPRTVQIGFSAPSPCIAVIENTLFIARNESILKQAIKAQNGSIKSLADSLDYKLIESRIKRLRGRKKAAGIMFTRPEEDMKWIYNMATDRNQMRFWQRQVEREEFLKKVDGVLTKNPLPPFETISKYLAPTGGIVVNDESGIHFIAFSLKRK